MSFILYGLISLTLVGNWAKTAMVSPPSSYGIGTSHISIGIRVACSSGLPNGVLIYSL